VTDSFRVSVRGAPGIPENQVIVVTSRPARGDRFALPEGSSIPFMYVYQVTHHPREYSDPNGPDMTLEMTVMSPAS